MVIKQTLMMVRCGILVVHEPVLTIALLRSSIAVVAGYLFLMMDVAIFIELCARNQFKMISSQANKALLSCISVSINVFTVKPLEKCFFNYRSRS